MQKRRLGIRDPSDYLSDIPAITHQWRRFRMVLNPHPSRTSS
jgi:hypothetical protein